MVEKVRIGISACLLGAKVRYDGGHKLDRYITETLGQFFDYVPVCPEVEYGLPVPREAMRLVGDPASPLLVTVRTGIDHTEGMKKWAERKLDDLGREGIAGFIFKSHSPSSGLRRVKVYPASGKPSLRGKGIFTAAFVRRNPLLPAIDDESFFDPDLRENFIESVFVYKLWLDFLKKGRAAKELVALHTDLKFLILAHSPKHYRSLGALVARAGSHGLDEIRAYGRLLSEALRFKATRPKNSNVLLHSVGYFKKQLTSGEKEELLEIIRGYDEGFLPLVVPVTLINHYIRKYDEDYLARQVYFNPHPAELMLRNHA